MGFSVSVVTVCYNEIDTISRCVESVVGQKNANIQYVVIDGCSTDGTSDILKKYGENIDKLVIEADEGIYSAMNKALKYCEGDIVYFLNADDYFYSDIVVEKAVKRFSDCPSLKILSGRVEFFNIPWRDGKPYARSDFSYSNKLELYRNPVPQQCIFVKRSLFEIHDGFNERYKMCADYDWLIRMLTHKVEVQQVDDYFCYFDYTGISYTQNKQRKREKNRIILFNSSFYELLVYGFSGVAGNIRKKLSGR
jgi:glycosyltransferase involved in cell wall biosynthesis